MWPRSGTVKNCKWKQKRQSGQLVSSNVLDSQPNKNILRKFSYSSTLFWMGRIIAPKFQYHTILLRHWQFSGRLRQIVMAHWLFTRRWMEGDGPIVGACWSERQCLQRCQLLFANDSVLVIDSEESCVVGLHTTSRRLWNTSVIGE